MRSIKEISKLFILFILLFASGSLHAEYDRPTEGSTPHAVSGLELNKNRFFRFNNSIELSFDLSLQKGYSQYFDYIVRIADLNKQSTELILNLQDNNQNELIIISNNRLSKKTIHLAKEDFQANPIHFNLLFDLKSDELTLSIADTVYIENRLGLKPHADYRIVLGAAKNGDASSAKTSSLLISNIETSPDLIGSDKLSQNTGSTLLWIVLIVVLDIFVFGYIIWKRKKRRAENAEPNSVSEEVESSIDTVYHFEKESRVEEKRKSAILLFNHFQVFDKEGTDISKKFSPLLKELFLILLLHSLKYKQGISTALLKDLLWFDKEPQSANNNRAVNIGKLKAILDTIGGYDLVSNNLNIHIELGDDIYCDYMLILNLLQQNSLNHEQVLTLISMTERGSFLPECNYEWIDRFKATISDSVIDNLLDLAELLNSQIDAKLIIQIADTIFNFDSLNERALILKCSALMCLGKHSLANTTYTRFVKDYQTTYQESYKVEFSDVCNRDTASMN